MASAFQQNGFQLNAFQIAFETEWAFQKCAFQYGAFQVEQCENWFRDSVVTLAGEATAVFEWNATAAATVDVIGASSCAWWVAYEESPGKVVRTLRIGEQLIAYSVKQSNVII